MRGVNGLHSSSGLQPLAVSAVSSPSCDQQPVYLCNFCKRPVIFPQEKKKKRKRSKSASCEEVLSLKLS